MSNVIHCSLPLACDAITPGTGTVIEYLWFTAPTLVDIVALRAAVAAQIAAGARPTGYAVATEAGAAPSVYVGDFTYGDEPYAFVVAVDDLGNYVQSGDTVGPKPAEG